MTRSPSKIGRGLTMGLALAAALSFGTADAFARAGKGGSFGSRGSMSRQAPPATDTAPRQAQPLPGPQTGSPSLRQGAATGATQPSRMGGLMGGLAAGFLGAGLFGLLSGQGFFSGIGSLLGILGFLVQIALVVVLARLAINYFRRRPATAGGPQGHERQAMAQGVGPAPGVMGAAASAAAPATGAVPLQERDFNAFERLLGEIQENYARGSRTGLHVRATPEMAAHLVRDLDDLDRRGLVNRLSDVKLLQGDLAEAWREGASEYATVAMRYAIVDATVEKATGRLVEGDPSRPQEVTEIWTFVRRLGESSEGWKLSAIQQA